MSICWFVCLFVCIAVIVLSSHCLILFKIDKHIKCGLLSAYGDPHWIMCSWPLRSFIVLWRWIGLIFIFISTQTVSGSSQMVRPRNWSYSVMGLGISSGYRHKYQLIWKQLHIQQYNTVDIEKPIIRKVFHVHL